MSAERAESSIHECSCGRKIRGPSYFIHARICSGGSRALHPTFKHGAHNTTEYRTWSGMWTRCTNANDRAFRWYGARGIVVCDRWNDFAAFLSDMGHRPFPTAEIDRIDNDGPYSPDNCRWTDRKTNMRNSRNALHTEISGVSRPISEWSDISGISGSTLRRRYQNGIRGAELLKPSRVRPR